MKLWTSAISVVLSSGGLIQPQYVGFCTGSLESQDYKMNSTLL